MQGGGEGFIRLGTDAEIGVGLGKDYASSGTYDIGCRQGKTPAGFAVDEGEIDEDGAKVVLVVFGDGVDEAELFPQGAAGIGEDGEGQAMLAGHEVVLALGLGADGDHEGPVLADGSVEVAPCLQLRGAVRAPASAEELEDERTEGEHVGRADEAAGGVVQGEVRRGGADGEDLFFDAGGEEFGDGAFADGQALGLHEVPGVGGDLVELVLEESHFLYSRRCKLA